MNYAILFERISEPDISADHWYAHIPTLGLTTHGHGIEGARQAAHDLAALWIAEKRANGETIAAPGEFFFSTLQLNEDHADGRQTYVAMHAADVPNGTFRAILEQAGLTEEQFRSL